MDDCNHCWHTHFTLTSMPPIKQQVCCYCGETRSKQSDPPGKGHGPHHPQGGGFVHIPASKIPQPATVEGNGAPIVGNDGEASTSTISYGVRTGS